MQREEGLPDFNSNGGCVTGYRGRSGEEDPTLVRVMADVACLVVNVPILGGVMS